jgi:hypothetical protein
MLRTTRLLGCAGLTALLLAAAAGAQAQGEGGPGVTRLLLTQVRVKPSQSDTWRALQRDQVVPALKKAGVKQYTVYETLVGEQTEFVIVRPLPSFAEFNGEGLLERALGAHAAATLRARLNDCIDSSSSRIENGQDEFFLDPGPAKTLFMSRYRAMPGRARDYMNFVRTEMMPPMRKAQQNGTFAGLTVTTSVQGGEPNIITLNMFYNDFAPLDGPPPVAKTLGPEGTAEFLRKGAGLITQLEQFVLKRVPELSY